MWRQPQKSESQGLVEKRVERSLTRVGQGESLCQGAGAARRPGIRVLWQRVDQGHGPRASAPAGYEDGAVLVESSQHFLLPGFPPPHDVPPSRLRGNTGARAEESRPQLRPAGALAERGAEGGAQTGRKMARRALSSSHLPTQSIFRVTAYSFPRLLQTPRPGPHGQPAGWYDTTQSAHFKVVPAG